MQMLDLPLWREALRRSGRQLPWLGPLFVGSAWLNLVVYRVMGVDPAVPMSAQPGLGIATLCFLLAILFVFGSIEMVIGLGLLRMLSKNEPVTPRSLARFTVHRFMASLRGFFPITWRLLLYSLLFSLAMGLFNMFGGGGLNEAVARMNDAAASPWASAVLGLLLFAVLLPVTFATFDCVYHDLSFDDAYALAKARVAPRRFPIALNLLLMAVPSIVLVLPGPSLTALAIQQTLSALLFIPPVMLFYLYQEAFEAEPVENAPLP